MDQDFTRLFQIKLRYTIYVCHFHNREAGGKSR